MSQEQSNVVDTYLALRTAPPNEALETAREAPFAAGMPVISLSLSLHGDFTDAVSTRTHR